MEPSADVYMAEEQWKNQIQDQATLQEIKINPRNSAL